MKPLGPPGGGNQSCTCSCPIPELTSLTLSPGTGLARGQEGQGAGESVQRVLPPARGSQLWLRLRVGKESTWTGCQKGQVTPQRCRLEA